MVPADHLTWLVIEPFYPSRSITSLQEVCCVSERNMEAEHTAGVPPYIASQHIKIHDASRRAPGKKKAIYLICTSFLRAS